MRTREIDWRSVRRVLVVRLRSIGDTVLCTPSLIALKRFLPEAQIDILLEDWVAPVLDGFESADNVLTVGPSAIARFAVQQATRHCREGYSCCTSWCGGQSSDSGAPSDREETE